MNFRAMIPFAALALLAVEAAAQDLVVRPLDRAGPTDARTILRRSPDVPMGVVLKHSMVLRGVDGHVERFHQVHRGLPVVGRGMTVSYGVEGTPRFSVARLLASLPDETTPTIDGLAAADIASKAAGQRAEDALLVIWPSGGHAALAYAVFTKATPLDGSRMVVVDANTGRVLHVESGTRFLGAARVFPVDPLRTPQLVDVTLPVGALEDGLANDRVIVRNCVDQRRVVRRRLFGQEMDLRVCDLTASAKPDPATGDFVQHVFESHELPEDSFAEVSAFHHTNVAFDYLARLVPELGVPLAGKPLIVVSNVRFASGYSSFDVKRMGDPDLALDPFRNAAYYGLPYTTLLGLRPWDPVVFLGQGRRMDASYDLSVVAHELTHGAVSQLGGLASYHRDTEGMHCSPGAMEEGIADYVASAIVGEPNFAPYFFTEFPDLDISRSLDRERHCPEWLTNEVHEDSMVFSGALWEARSGLTEPSDREAFDRAVLTAVATLPSPDVGFAEMSEVLLATVAASPIGSVAEPMLGEALSRRGIRFGCRRVLTWTGEPLRPPGSGPGGSYVSPGRDGADVDFLPGSFQAEVKLEPDVTAVRVTLSSFRFDADTSDMGLAGPSTGAMPFTPAALVRFGEPVSFRESEDGWQTEADSLIELTREGDEWAGSVDVRGGSSTVYVMVVNRGDQSGRFVDLSFELLSTEPARDIVSAQPSGGCHMVRGARAVRWPWWAGLLSWLAVYARLRRRRAAR